MEIAAKNAKDREEKNFGACILPVPEVSHNYWNDFLIEGGQIVPRLGRLRPSADVSFNP